MTLQERLYQFSKQKEHLMNSLLDELGIAYEDIFPNDPAVHKALDQDHDDPERRRWGV